MKINIFRYLQRDYIPWQFWWCFGIGITAFIILGLYFSAEIGALIFTAVFIAWYSLETRNLVKETKMANQLSSEIKAEMVMTNRLTIQPCVIMKYSSDSRWHLELENIGNGPAINIRIESKHEDYQFSLYKNILAPRESGRIILSKKGSRLEDIDSEFRNDAVQAIIYFDRIKERRAPLTTLVEIKAIPHVNVLEKDWGLD